MWAVALLLRALLALLSPSGWWPPPPRQPCRVVSRTDSPFAGLSFPPHAPPTLCPWYHTLVGALFGPRVEYRRELLRGPGGPFALDWALGGGTAPRAALLLATPTCSDSAGSNVRSLAAAAVARGLAVAVYNRRGHSGVGLEAGRAFPLYGDAADMGHAVAHVGAALPGVPLLCVGLSAGAAETVFFLASDHPAASRVAGGVSVSNGHDLPRFERANPGAARHLVAKFRALMRRPCNAAALSSACAASRFSSPRTFRELEAALVLCGAADADALAAGRRCTAQLAAVRVPLLCLGAADDPLVPAALTSLADAAALANPLVVSATTPTGGHLGWLQRRSDGRSDRWWTAAALDFVDAVLEGA